MPIQRGAPLGAPSRECLPASRDDHYTNQFGNATGSANRPVRSCVVNIAAERARRARAATAKAAQQRPIHRQTIEEILSGLPPFDGDAA